MLANGLEPAAERTRGAELVLALLPSEPMGPWRVWCGTLRAWLSAPVVMAKTASPQMPARMGQFLSASIPQGDRRTGEHGPFGKNMTHIRKTASNSARFWAGDLEGLDVVFPVSVL